MTALKIINNGRRYFGEKSEILISGPDTSRPCTACSAASGKTRIPMSIGSGVRGAPVGLTAHRPPTRLGFGGYFSINFSISFIKSIIS